MTRAGLDALLFFALALGTLGAALTLLLRRRSGEGAARSAAATVAGVAGLCFGLGADIAGVALLAAGGVGYLALTALGTNEEPGNTLDTNEHVRSSGPGAWILALPIAAAGAALLLRAAWPLPATFPVEQAHGSAAERVGRALVGDAALPLELLALVLLAALLGTAALTPHEPPATSGTGDRDPADT